MRLLALINFISGGIYIINFLEFKVDLRTIIYYLRPYVGDIFYLIFSCKDGYFYFFFYFSFTCMIYVYLY